MLAANPALVRRLADRWSDGVFALAALTAIALTALVAAGARSWIDQPFAGFFVLADRTVPPIGRAAWNAGDRGRLYDRTVVAIDGVTVAHSDDVHRRLAAKPLGSSFAVTLAGGGRTDTVTVASRAFSVGDYWAVFGAYLFTGLLYLLLAILAAWALPANRVGRALMLVGGAGGLFMLSAADLYPPGASLRVHVLTTVLLPATLVHFALVVGATRRWFADLATSATWTLTLAAALSMQLLLGEPAAAPALDATAHATLAVALGAATIALIGARTRVAFDAEPLLGCAAVFGLGAPALVFLLAALGAGVPVNAGATLGFLFPLGVGAGLLVDRIGVGALDVARSAGSL